LDEWESPRFLEEAMNTKDLEELMMKARNYGTPVAVLDMGGQMREIWFRREDALGTLLTVVRVQLSGSRTESGIQDVKFPQPK
jgi:hypothetical protein